ncbi:hypothetical protein ACL02U_27105 [Streptomyces sp. MS06]|uniref:hypothetical protein n=1 Tax=Streptomyces sp. MS06 TaxID=3385974 RepID=UPI0039A39955
MSRQRNACTSLTGRQRRAGDAGRPLLARGPRVGAAAALCAAALLLAGCRMPAPHVPVRDNAQGGRTFYVSPDGDDRAGGRTPETAWRTLTHADSMRFRPGDVLRLRGGARFPGTFSIGAGDAGDAGKPVVVESYGTGRATIAASGTRGIEVHDTGGVTVRNLIVTGDAESYREQDGIAFVSDLRAAPPTAAPGSGGRSRRRAAPSTRRG